MIALLNQHEAQPDKMLVKMPLETAQMLCTAHRELDGDGYADKVGLYKRAYWNHPCTIWAREGVMKLLMVIRSFSSTRNGIHLQIW
jgi:hypothetical protein